MKRTRLSLFYLAGYVLPAGVALLVAPRFATKLLLSNGEYPDVIVRMVGVPLFALGVFIVQLIRHRLEVLYTTTLAVRVFICASFIFLYATSGDPMFLVLLAIVSLGFVLTATSYWLDVRGRR